MHRSHVYREFSQHT